MSRRKTNHIPMPACSDTTRPLKRARVSNPASETIAETTAVVLDDAKGPVVPDKTSTTDEDAHSVEDDTLSSNGDLNDTAQSNSDEDSGEIEFNNTADDNVTVEMVDDKGVVTSSNTSSNQASADTLVTTLSLKPSATSPNDATKDILPVEPTPNVQRKDPFLNLREPCLESTYTSLPVLKPVRDSLNNKQDDDYPYPGFLFADLLGILTDEQHEFLMKAINFVMYGKKVVNPSRADPTKPGMRFGPLPEDRSPNANKFLMLGSNPLLCLSTVVIASSDFSSMRTFSTGETQYGVKDARVQFPRHEWQRLVAFMGNVLHVSKLYFNGMAVGIPTINVGTRFVTMDALRGARSANRSTSKWGPLPSATSTTDKDGRSGGRNRCVLFPTDEVPVYDFSGLNFDFSDHLDLEHLDLEFDRILGEPIANVPALIAYYPSVWIKDGKPVVTLNISWAGVLEA